MTIQKLNVTRRSFVSKLLTAGTAISAAAGTGLISNAARAADANCAPRRDCTSVAFHNPHTSEDINIRFYGSDGQYNIYALRELSWFFRDFRRETPMAIDPALFDQLALLRRTLNTDKPFQLISGYRTPETNAMLRGGNPSTGVALNSYHCRAMASDIAVEGISTEALRNAAQSLNLGGVGYYPSSGFVHVDTGPVRTWS